MGQGYRGLELAALPEYTPPLPRAGPGANVSHEVAMILIDGKQTARDIRAELKAQVEAAVSAGRRAPGLAVILVGEDPASQVYVRNKERACAEAGILSFPYRLPADTTQEALLADNAHYRKMCETWGYPCILIDRSYRVELPE